jgi:hypothetical protein
VLIHVDTDLGAKDLLNHRMAYVSVSRGQWDAQILTNDRSALANALSRDVSHQSAHRPQQAVALVPQDIGQTNQVDRDFGMGIGMGF